MPTVRVAPPTPARARSGPVTTLGVLCLVLFLFASYSRLTDTVLVNWQFALITSLLAFVATVLTGGVQRALSSRVGMWLSLFTIWLVLAAPFSVWQGGSAHFLWDQWLKSFLVFVIIAGLLRSARQCRMVMYTIAAATTVIVILCLILGRTEKGRLALSEGVLSNPNDLAQLLLMGAPFLLLVAMSRRGAFLTRPLVATCIGGVILITASTGSRGALVAVMFLVIVMFLNFSIGSKLKLLAAVVLIGISVVPLTSPEQWRRFLTIAQEGTEENLGEAELSAIGSRGQRIDLLWESVGLTITHPIFGVGPGQYQSATNDLDRAQGRSGRWKESHNAYTQVSSEAGVPAFIFYVAALVTCLRMSRSIYKRTRLHPEMVDQANAAYCLWLSLISFAVTSFFSSVAYLPYFPMLAGLSVALSLAVEPELAVVSTDPGTHRGPVPQTASQPPRRLAPTA